MLIAINDSEIINTDKFSHFDLEGGLVLCFVIGGESGAYIVSQYAGDDAVRLWSKLCKAAGKPEPFPRPVHADNVADAVMRQASQDFNLLDRED